MLCYFPETDTYAVSGIYERYAFDTYYKVDLSEGSVLKAKKNYDYTWETISLVARIVITILLEMGLAMMFGYRHKKQLRFLAAVNIVTQILLNILLIS